MFLRNVKWDITKRCFLGCYFCLNAQERRAANTIEISYEEKIAIVDKLAASGVKRIQLLGGEPLYSNGIFDLLDYIGSKGLSVGINTNGVMLSEANILRILNAGCVNDITVSLDGLEKLHNEIRAANIFNLIIENLKKLIKLKKQKNVKLDVGINTVLTGKNTDDIYSLLYMLDEIGVDYWNGLELIQIDNKTNKNITIFTLDEIIEILKKLGIIQKKISLNIKAKFTFPFIINYVNDTYNLNLRLSEHFCGAGLTFAYIDWSGKFYPCDRTLPNKNNKNIYKGLKNTELYLNKISLEKCITSDLFKSFSFLYADESLKPRVCKGCPYYKQICYPCTATLKYSDLNEAYGYCLVMKERILNNWIKQFKVNYSKIACLIPDHIVLQINASTIYLFDLKLDNIYEIEDNIIKAILVALYNKGTKYMYNIFSDVLSSQYLDINVFEGYDLFLNSFIKTFNDLHEKGVICVV